MADTTPSKPSSALSPASVHAHSPALLRQAIQKILEERALLRRDPPLPLLLSIVSHPPSPTSADFPENTESSSIRPLNTITPLDFTRLERIALSTPGPRTPGGGELHETEIKGEEDYPLILVTGKPPRRVQGERQRGY